MPVKDAAGAEGIHISSKTALRWCLGGLRGVVLESLKVRGQRVTSRAAIRRFIAATQTDPIPAISGIDREGAARVAAAFGCGRGGRR